MLLVAVQIGLPAKGTCGAAELRHAKVECCQVGHEPAVKSCCHSKHVQPQGPLPEHSDCGDQRPCCGCCHVVGLFHLLPDLNFRFETVNVDRVDTVSNSLSGITHAPPTPPPNFRGEC
ncbi:MAG: hypothetical protein DWH81_03030 [Planctomycetota bacterium]|nr:MAG: hypothetical protein DWH81_03030 [Planctomycetota bacterium]